MGRRAGEKLAAVPATPPRLFAIVHKAEGAIASPAPLAARSIAVVYTTPEHAEQELLSADIPETEAQRRESWHAVEYVPAIPPPPRETPWGEGQHDHVELAPGMCAALRITPDGDVVLISPAAGELTVTSGGTALGLGLLEAGRRAAEVRVELLERARRCKREPRCKRCDQPLFYLRGTERIPARMHCPKAGAVPCIPRDQDVRRAARGGR